jgi:CubicO group peptidase (beta-lactamase class C family)
MAGRVFSDRTRAVVLGTVALALGLEVALFAAGVDLRRVPDLLADALVLVTLLVSLAALVALPRRRRTKATAWTVAGALVGVSVWLVVALGDFSTWLVFLGFLLAIAGLLAAVGAVVAVLVSLLRRRGRVGALLAVVAAVELAALAGSAIVFLNPRPPSVPVAFTGAADLDSYLQRLVATGSPPSVSAVVVRDGQTLYANAFGFAYRPAQTPATVETVDKWWSVTKVATAVAVLQLAEQGRLQLDQPVPELLPSFRVEPEARASEVTVADLLNHSAGLSNNVPEVVGWMHLEDEPALDQAELFRERFGGYAHLQREPGTLGVYSNVDYLVLGALIAKTSGEPFEQYVTRYVLEPLEMIHTGFAYTDWMRAHEGVGSHPAANVQTLLLPVLEAPWPSGYIRSYDNGTIWFNRFLADNTPPTGLIGPAPEMMRLAQAILQGGSLDGHRILSRASVETMLTSYQVPAGASSERSLIGKDDVRHGIAWFIVHDGDRTYYEHTGGGPGWAALMRIYPDEQLAIVLMGNGTLLPSTDLADAIARTAW